ncbi:FAD binding domain-containing protein [Pantoea sp. SGAir0215]
MNEFRWQVARSVTDAAGAKQHADNQLIAGGTTQLDLMKCGVMTPSLLTDIAGLSDLSTLEFGDDKITIGALVTMSELASHPDCEALAPALYGSLWQAASPQIRNMATIGGNLCQRTRCAYYRDPATFSACNKRTPGSGCAALHGINASHAILGGSEQCVAVYPGDLAVALTAFDATIIVQNSHQDTRRIPVDDFFLLPGETPQHEHALQPDEIIVAIEIPRSLALKQSHYLKVRDRTSYEFASASAAVGLTLAQGRIETVHIALGGVATKPWRARQVEHALTGQRFEEQSLYKAAELITQETRALAHNAYKITLTPRVIARALLAAGELA